MDTDKLRAALKVLPISPPYPCSYLPHELAKQQQFFWSPDRGPLSPELYQSLMDHRFRRSGRLLYRPVCEQCQKCVPLRMLTKVFEPSQSQRRVLKKNLDLELCWERPVIDDQRIDLYRRYVQARHREGEVSDQLSDDVAEELERFLYDSPTDTLEGAYYFEGRLIAIGICDRTPQALSTVYFYFDPEEGKRSLGVYSALQEIAFAAQHGLDYYYLGYWIADCRKMAYKSGLGAHEILTENGWVARET